ncbi:MAG: hypothetical protein M3Q44_06620 [bacterium]|nr:hypothetical protein [bacterium]
MLRSFTHDIAENMKEAIEFPGWMSVLGLGSLAFWFIVIFSYKLISGGDHMMWFLILGLIAGSGSLLLAAMLNSMAKNNMNRYYEIRCLERSRYSR